MKTSELRNEINTLKQDVGFISWLNNFQRENCYGCKFANMGPIGQGEMCCDLFGARSEHGRCLDRKAKAI